MCSLSMQKLILSFHYQITFATNGPPTTRVLTCSFSVSVALGNTLKVDSLGQLSVPSVSRNSTYVASFIYDLAEITSKSSNRINAIFFCICSTCVELPPKKNKQTNKHIFDSNLSKFNNPFTTAATAQKAPAVLIGDVTKYSVSFVVTSSDGVPFNFQLRQRPGTLTALFHYCTLDRSASQELTLDGTTSMQLLRADGSQINLQSVSGSMSKISQSGSCFKAHAVIAGITGSLSVKSIVVNFTGPSSIPGINTPCSTQGSDACSQSTAQLRSYFPQLPFQNSLRLAIDQPGVLSQAAGQILAASIINTIDNEPPVWDGCPSVIEAVGGYDGGLLPVSWVVPTVSDNVAVRSVDDEVNKFGGSLVTHYLDPRTPLYPWVYTAVDAFGLTSYCR